MNSIELLRSDYCTVNEYAAKHNIPLSTVQCWIKTNKLPAVKLGYYYAIKKDEPIPDFNRDTMKNETKKRSRSIVKTLTAINELCDTLLGVESITKSDDRNDYITVREFAQKNNAPVSSVYTRLSYGLIKSKKFGSGVYLHKDTHWRKSNKGFDKQKEIIDGLSEIENKLVQILQEKK